MLEFPLQDLPSASSAQCLHTSDFAVLPVPQYADFMIILSAPGPQQYIALRRL